MGLLEFTKVLAAADWMMGLPWWLGGGKNSCATEHHLSAQSRAHNLFLFSGKTDVLPPLLGISNGGSARVLNSTPAMNGTVGRFSASMSVSIFPVMALSFFTLTVLDSPSSFSFHSCISWSSQGPGGSGISRRD
jgi:hypothetical protein